MLFTSMLTSLFHYEKIEFISVNFATKLAAEIIESLNGVVTSYK